MEVFINGRFLTQRITGVQRVAHQIVKALDQKAKDLSFNITILTPEPIDHDQLPLKNIAIKKVGFLKGHLWEQLNLPFYSRGNVLIDFCNTGPILKRKQIVYLHDASIYSQPDGYSKKFILWYKFLYTFLSRFSQRVITVSHFSKDELIKFLPSLKEKTKVTHIAANHFDKVGTDESVLSQYHIDKNNYLLAVSSLHPNKNFKIILEALEKMETFKGQVVIAGNNDNKVFSKVNFDNSENVKMVGYVTDEQLKSLYQNAKGFIFPSLYEGFGLPPLEAMSQGCPVIASTAASIPEVCSYGALYFDPYDANDLINQINRLFNHEDEYKSLREQGLRRSKEFSWEKTTDGLIEEIKSML
ncbi:glycosyltransferase family 1 protein [Pullulanibacillus sp. KACC 23026]|uniref:glycosyltransferase family 4 protein n=1 Tax=Pullulanibacillus sp. KACC 23026 TaxID=3028315 RepID=UPI0023AFE21F|nr:glycosyltransferase family 1 protein [Pullulanibacillus sp. KACC 23026]WEG13414.1 glycosyltransferase family 1 protein [Pullulanibacillus sp. KACC 23026]